MTQLDADAKDALWAALPVPMVVYHAPTDRPDDMRLVAANRAISSLMGADLTRGIGRTVGELFARSVEQPESRARLDAMHRVAVEGGEETVGPIDSSDPRLDGWYRMSLIGLPGRRVAVLFEDVTRSVAQAEQLRIWSGLARSISVGIVVATRSGEAPLAGAVIAHNPAAAQIFGLGDEGGRLGDVLSDWLDATQRAALLAAIAGGEAFEWHRPRGDAVFRMRMAVVGGWLMFSATDDTEGARLRAAIERHAELLQHSNDELAAFAHVVSHDLQSPMRSMAAFSELLGRRYAGQLDERADRYLSHITGGARRMRSLVSDLLVWSRFGRDGAAPAWVDLDRVAGGVVADLAARVEQTGGRVEHAELPTVWGVEGLLVRLLQNLVDNGLKYHRPGVPPRVSIRGAENGGGWWFAVEDNGIGIPAARREEAFDPLRRLGEHAVEGSGLGLAICRRIVQRCRGRIRIEDVEGQGTRVVVELPRPEVLEA